MVDTFGLKMVGLKEAANATAEYAWRGLYYDEIFYNIRTGKVWLVHRVSVNRTSPSEYENQSVVKIANNTSKLSEQQLAVKIYRNLVKSGRIQRNV